MLYAADSKGPLHVAGWHDANSKRLIGITFRPPTWATATVYYWQDADNYSTVIPTSFTGVYYKVVTPGKSGATEPTWIAVPGEQTIDGSVVWEAVAYNLMVPEETITAVTYAGTDGIVLTGTSNTTVSCQFMIPTLPIAAVATGYFIITVHVVKSNGEEMDIELYFRVKA